MRGHRLQVWKRCWDHTLMNSRDFESRCVMVMLVTPCFLLAFLLVLYSILLLLLFWIIVECFFETERERRMIASRKTGDDGRRKDKKESKREHTMAWYDTYHTIRKEQTRMMPLPCQSFARLLTSLLDHAPSGSLK